MMSTPMCFVMSMYLQSFDIDVDIDVLSKPDALVLVDWLYIDHLMM